MPIVYRVLTALLLRCVDWPIQSIVAVRRTFSFKDEV